MQRSDRVCNVDLSQLEQYMNRRHMLGSAGCAHMQKRRVPNYCPLSVEARPRSTLPLSVELYDARLPTSALVVLP